MSDRERIILKSIDDLADECVKYLESNFSIIPNIGIINIDLIVLASLMRQLLNEREFKGKKMAKFLSFYENHFITVRSKTPRKTTVYNLKNDEIDWKNLVAYIKFEKMKDAEKSEFFIRTLSNISSDIDKFADSVKNYSKGSKFHYPRLALINIYINPLFCHTTPKNDYDQEIRWLSAEIKNSSIDLDKFFVSFSKMWIDVISKNFQYNFLLLDLIESNFPTEPSFNQSEEKQTIKTQTSKNSGCMLFLSIIVLISVISFLL